MAKHCPNPNCAGLARDGCVAEYGDAVETCLDCGSSLLPGEALSDPDPAFEYNELRTVFIADNVVQGHLVAGAIEAEGIPVYLKGEMLQGAINEHGLEDDMSALALTYERLTGARIRPAD